eukprot:CAMPEP_0114333848 /NCGR_PEP_ID=MMETSP0101-20121206/4013_1 /TAXON_ID=38822 ORGANISM="Pteridomonas danica, Strain PT" /NCGR_SAMPLE_ID=MMETSP0101 /ASSEMBLY_ACC=CAM_ASM_000211 /LENGTH=813 /DNA_ID=CAMNT_0001464973 /DNA_START=513 /DNA_END=2954 /DNA_ORIENTATION=-
MGGIFVPKYMHEALILEQHKKLRAEWIAARRGPPPVPKVSSEINNVNEEGEDDGYAYEKQESEESIQWQQRNEALEIEARNLNFQTMSFDSPLNTPAPFNRFDTFQSQSSSSSFRHDSGEQDDDIENDQNNNFTFEGDGDNFLLDSGTLLSTVYSSDGAHSTTSAEHNSIPYQTMKREKDVSVILELGESFEGTTIDQDNISSIMMIKKGEQDQDIASSIFNQEEKEKEEKEAQNLKANEEKEEAKRVKRQEKLLKTQRIQEQFMKLAHAANRVAQESSLISAERGGSGKCLGVALSPGSEYLVLNAEDALPILDAICERSGRNAVLRAVGLRCLLHVATPHSAPAGHVLCSQDEFSDAVHILVQGECRLAYRENDGTSRQLAVLGPTSIIGDEGAFLNLKNSAAVVCSSNVKYLSIGNRILKRELDLRPELLSLIRTSTSTKKEWIDIATKNENKKLCWGDGGILNEISIALELDGLGGQSPFRGWSELPKEDSKLPDLDEINLIATVDELNNTTETLEEEVEVTKDDDDEGSVNYNSAASIASAELAEEKRLKLVKQMLVRTYDGLDPSAQALYQPAPWKKEKAQSQTQSNQLNDALMNSMMKEKQTGPATGTARSRGAQPGSSSNNSSKRNSQRNSPRQTQSQSQDNGGGVQSGSRSRHSARHQGGRHPQGAGSGVVIASRTNSSHQAFNKEEENLLAINAELAGELPMAWPLPIPPRKIHPLEPFPTLTRNRSLHASKLPKVSKSIGFEIATSLVKKKASNDFEGEAWRRQHVFASMPKDVAVKLKMKDMMAIERAVDKGLGSLRQSNY